MSEKEQRELLGTCMRDIVPHRLNHHVIGWCQGWEPIASPQAERPVNEDDTYTSVNGELRRNYRDDPKSW